MEQIFAVYELIAIMFVLILIGAYLNRTEKVTAEAEKGIANITIEIAFPALIFTSIISNFRVDMLEEYAVFPLYGAGVSLLGILFSYLVSKYIFKQQEGFAEFAFVSSFSNNIYIGVPLILALFGEQGLIMAILYDFGMALVLWSVGIWILNNEQQGFNLKAVKNILSPPVAALILGVVVKLSGLNIPQFIIKISSMVGNLTVPLAMIFIGIELAKKRLDGSLLNSRVYAVSIIRLIIIPILMLLTVRFLNYPPQAAGVLVIEAGMPVFASATVIMKKYNKKMDFAAAAIFATTILIAVTVPVYLWLLTA